MGEQLAFELELGVPDVEVHRAGSVRLRAVRCAAPAYSRDRLYVWRRGRVRRVRTVRVRLAGVL